MAPSKYLIVLPCLLLLAGSGEARSLRSIMPVSLRQLKTNGCASGVMWHVIEGQQGHCGSTCNLGDKSIMKSVDDCAKRCLETDGCKSAFYRPQDGLCSMKNVAWDSLELDISDEPQKKSLLIAPCEETKSEPQWKLCHHAKDYDVEQGVTLTCGDSCNYGDSAEVDNQDACVAMCLADSGCKCAFYDSMTKKCDMKNIRCNHPALGMTNESSATCNAIMKCPHTHECVGGPHGSDLPKISELDETVEYTSDTAEELCVCTSKNFMPADWMCVSLKPTMCVGGPYDAATPEESADGTQVAVTTADNKNEDCTCKVDRKSRTFSWECVEVKPPSPCDSFDGCAGTYGICGGSNHMGGSMRCCSDNDRCILQNEFYAECVPRSQPVTPEWIGTILSDCAAV